MNKTQNNGLFKPCFQNYLNHALLKRAERIGYTVSDFAPSDEKALFNEASLVIWSGASENTIFADSRVNWAFRAIHDNCHLKSGLGFTVDDELTLGHYQASLESCPYLKAITECEIGAQALYYKQNGVFVPNQLAFAKETLSNNSLFKGLIL